MAQAMEDHAIIKSANNYPVSQHFDIDSKVAYVVPRYQRAYTWGKGEWELLFDDLLENEPGYFLGSIICINQAADTHDVQLLELVDGQQRLTTLSLLFTAVYDCLSNGRVRLLADHDVEVTNLKRKMVCKWQPETPTPRVALQIQNHNDKDYLAVLADAGAIEGAYQPPRYAGNRKIFRAYRYFQQRVAEMETDTEDQSQPVQQLLEKINKACLVKIEVASHADAYTLFESLNNRGVPLTAIDLIKNRVLFRLERESRGNIEVHYQRWNQLLVCLGDDHAIQERFFRQYYNAFKGELSSIHRVSVATRSNLVAIYEALISQDANQFLDDIAHAGQFYSKILVQDEHDKQNMPTLIKPLKDLEHIQGSPSYLLLLYLFVKQHEHGLESEHLVSVTELLVRFFVRRNLTDTPPTRDLTRMFMDIIEAISGQQGMTVIDSVKGKLISVSADDTRFQQAMEGQLYEENSGVARFILCALVEHSMTRETWVDLWRTKGKQFEFTIEHVLPQGDHLPQAWIEMIADGDSTRAAEIQQTHVHTLGNLTITAYNSTLGNKSFHEKRDRTDQQERYIGYKNGFALNADLANANHWSAQQIDHRTTRLVKQALDLFRL